jgi:F-type H+-transporting ATPase subunit beta
MDELSEEDKMTVNRAPQDSKLPSQPFHVAEQVHRISRTVRQTEGHHRRIQGAQQRKYDDSSMYPEQAFYMAGTIDEAEEKAKKLRDAAK